MITNERQYRISRSERDKFQRALETFDPLIQIKSGIDPLIVDAQKRAIKSQIQELNEELERFESLQAGEIVNLEANDFAQIGRKLIEARIARSMSQKQLAQRLRMKPQQIQRYENEEYQTANLPRLAEVAAALEIETFVRVELKSLRNEKSTVSTDAMPLLPLPVRTMKKRNWFENMVVRDDDDIKTDAQRAFLYVQRYAHYSRQASLHKQTVRVSGKYDEGALLAWKARILQLASDESPTLDGMDASEPNFTKELAKQSAFPDGPRRAIQMLKEVGVTVVIERHLQKTHLDGASMLLDRKHPVIGLTIRHDRLDNFWFVLLHELGHIIQHRKTGLSDGFFDGEEAESIEQFEIEADDFARNVLIPDEVWRSSFVRFSSTKSKIVDFAKRLAIHPAIVAGRIRHERNLFNDRTLNGLVGPGALRNLLGHDAGIPGGYNAD